MTEIKIKFKIKKTKQGILLDPKQMMSMRSKPKKIYKQVKII